MMNKLKIKFKEFMKDFCRVTIMLLLDLLAVSIGAVIAFILYVIGLYLFG